MLFEEDLWYLKERPRRDAAAAVRNLTKPKPRLLGDGLSERSRWEESHIGAAARIADLLAGESAWFVRQRR